MKNISKNENGFICAKGFRDHGYVTLTAVLIMLSIIVSASVSLLIIATVSNQVSASNLATTRAKAAADSCANMALSELRTNYDYTAGGTLNLLNGKSNCTVNAVLGSGASNRTLRVTGTSGNVTQKVVIIINSLNPIDISSWKYVADF